jgi:hypothetical protein
MRFSKPSRAAFENGRLFGSAHTRSGGVADAPRRARSPTSTNERGVIARIRRAFRPLWSCPEDRASR